MNIPSIALMINSNNQEDTIFAIIAFILIIIFSIVARHFLGSATLIDQQGAFLIRGISWIPKKYEFIGNPDNLLRISKIDHTNPADIIYCIILKHNLSVFLSKLWGPIWVVEFKSSSNNYAIAVDSIDDSTFQAIQQLRLPQQSFSSLSQFTRLP